MPVPGCPHGGRFPRRSTFKKKKNSYCVHNGNGRRPNNSTIAKF
jgi:hypothetical protein